MKKSALIFLMIFISLFGFSCRRKPKDYQTFLPPEEKSQDGKEFESLPMSGESERYGDFSGSEDESIPSPTKSMSDSELDELLQRIESGDFEVDIDAESDDQDVDDFLKEF